MDIRIEPTKLHGEVRAVASKSMAHRLLICAGLAREETEIVCRELSRDIEATADCLRSLGAHICYENGVFHISPPGRPSKRAALDCGESGSTVRFLLPVVCALGAEATIRLHGRLPERPLSPLWEELEKHGAALSRPARDLIAVSGRFAGGACEIAADVSSQFISGLLLALPIAGGGTIRLTGRPESAPYIEMSRRAQALFGVTSSFDGERFTVPAQSYRSPGHIETEGDWSAAAFWVVANALSGSGVFCAGLDPDSAQGDRAVVELTEQIRRGNAEIDARDIPDLVPVLAVLAAVSPGKTAFINAGRLRLKESDRLATTAAMLRALGGEVEETVHGLLVTGRDRLAGGTVDSAGDHRIAMSAAVASVACTAPVTILGAESVEKSYPDFWRDFQSLGGRVLFLKDA